MKTNRLVGILDTGRRHAAQPRASATRGKKSEKHTGMLAKTYWRYGCQPLTHWRYGSALGNAVNYSHCWHTPQTTFSLLF